MEVLRTPPAAIDSEAYVLGALLLTEGRAWDQADWIKPEWFYRAAHRIIFEKLREMCEAGRAVDVLLVGDALGSELENVGGAAYLGQLVIDVPAVSNLKAHAEKIERAYTHRMLIAAAVDVQTRAYDGVEEPATLADEASGTFAALMTARGTTGDMVSFGDAVAQAIDYDEQPARGLSTGFLGIDRAFKGLQLGQLIIIAARPGMGKSALTMNICENVAADHAVLFVSLEMSARALGARALRYHEERIGRAEAYHMLAKRRLTICQKPAIGVAYLRAVAKRIKRQKGLDLLAVDYLQLMTGSGENRQQEIAGISRGLKALALDLEIPIIAVAQLSRSVENRNDRRPQLADLRESGQIEQDADVIAFLYRPDYYDDAAPAGLTELLIRKHRDGATGTTYLHFTPEHVRFRDHVGEVPELAPKRQPRCGVVASSDFKSRAAGEAA